MTHEPYVKIRLANHSCFVVVLVRLGAAAAVAPEWLRSDHGAARESVEPARLAPRWEALVWRRDGPPSPPPSPRGDLQCCLKVRPVGSACARHRAPPRYTAMRLRADPYRSQITNKHKRRVGGENTTRHSRGVRVLPEPIIIIRRELPPRLPPKAKLRTSGAPLERPDCSGDGLGERHSKSRMGGREAALAASARRSAGGTRGELDEAAVPFASCMRQGGRDL